MASKTDFEITNRLIRIDWLAAMVIFILPLIGIAVSGKNLSRWMINILIIFFFGSIICALVLAVIRGFPRWSLSYLGLGLTIIVFYGLGLVLWGVFFYPAWMLIFGPMNAWPLPVRLLYSGLMVTVMWFLVLFIAISLLILFRHQPHIDALWKDIHKDWTQLSFVVYGGLIFYIWLIFDEYQHEGPWIFAAFTCLAAGAYCNLVAKEHNKRLLALVIGASMALWMVAIGKWNIVPIQNWPVDLAAERSFESLRTLTAWISIMAALFAPALLDLWPRISKQMPREDHKPV